MANTRSGPAQNPLKHFEIEDKKDLITMLNVAQLFHPENSHDDFSKAMAHQYLEDTCSNFGANDLRSIFRYLKANPKHRGNDYARLEKLAAENRYGDGIPEVQDALKAWELLIWQTKQRK